tara:strand:+ start:22177 stop:23277 length:1101 start_codon:yes stop_codon:yes gene_type:complete
MEVKFNEISLQYLKLKEEIDDTLNQIISNSEFIGGKHVDNFEKSFADLIGTNYSVSCNNGTDALYIAMKALGVKPGDEVITTSHTWIATSEAISRAGGTPVFCDTERASYCIDPSLIEEKVTERTKGIIPVHLYGYPCNMDEILKIAEKFNLWIVEDCAQAHLAEYKGKKVGTFGEISTFSFYPGKNLGAMGDAGCLNTNSKSLADWCRLYANHGGKGEHTIEGINSRMDSIQAAILNIKIKYIDEWTELRIKKAEFYNTYLNNISQIELPYISLHDKHVYHLYTIQTEKRDELNKFLNSKNIQTKINYPMIVPLLPAYKHLNYSLDDFPISFKSQSKILSLPLYPEISSDKQLYIIENIKNFFEI